jgi:hypothetical protein
MCFEIGPPPPQREEGSDYYWSLPSTGSDSSGHSLANWPPDLEDQVPVFTSPSDWVTQLYPQALDSLFVAFCDSQGYGEGILSNSPPHGNFDLIIRIVFDEEYKLCSLLQHHITSTFFSPNVLLGTLFSNTFRLYSSLNARDQVSNPYKTAGKIIILYILSFKFLDSRREDKGI